jgi:hypothetical protein
VIKQFTITQGNNQGRMISKRGGVVTVRAIVIAKTYEWSSVDVTDTSASGDTVFVFDSANTDAGILTITLKATTNAHSSERVLKLAGVCWASDGFTCTCLDFVNCGIVVLVVGNAIAVIIITMTHQPLAIFMIMSLKA